METNTRDRDEAGECREEEDSSPEIVPLRLWDREGLVELLLLVGVRRRVVWRGLLIAGILVVIRLLVILLLVWLLLVVLLLVRLLLIRLLLSIGRAAKELVGGTAVGLLLCHCDHRDGQSMGAGIRDYRYSITDAGANTLALRILLVVVVVVEEGN